MRRPEATWGYQRIRSYLTYTAELEPLPRSLATVAAKVVGVEIVKRP